MVENKNKGLLLGVAAATALVGAALLYHYVFSDPEEEENSVGIMELLKEAKLDQVKKAPSGNMLDPKYMLELLNFIAKTGRKRREAERNAALEQRRQAYKDQDWKLYHEIVAEQFQKEDLMC